MSDDDVSADAALRAVLDSSLAAVGTRPLQELLAEVVRGLQESVAARWAQVTVWAAEGRPELAATAGPDDVENPPRTRLSAPLTVRGRPVGAVQVAGSAGGLVVGDLESMVQTAAAGIAGIIERARTTEANRRRERWLSGGTEIARALTATSHDDPLAMIAERAAEIGGADAVALLSRGNAPGLFRVDAAAGAVAFSAGDYVSDTDGEDLQRVLDDGRPIRLDEIQASLRGVELLVDSAVLAPMHGSTGLRGVMAFGRVGQGAFDEAELGMASMFAGTVALALELAESQSRREQTALIVERDRIARDLHDHVIQRLYAIGLTMQHVSSMVGAETADRLIAAVTDIDAAIAQIRSTIFRLTMPILGADVSLRARADALVVELEPVLGYRPALVSEGPLDFGLDDGLVADCEAVLREGITNIARHAAATRADVRIAVARNRVQIVISDNGVGLGATDRRSGLANLRRRAEQHGGTLQIGDVADGGTRIEWTVPLAGTTG